LGTVGNLGWNNITGPAYWDVAPALSRRFPVREQQAVEVRADAFNVGNNFVPAFSGTNPAGARRHGRSDFPGRARICRLE
jgi:hypothetical protein